MLRFEEPHAGLRDSTAILLWLTCAKDNLASVRTISVVAVSLSPKIICPNAARWFSVTGLVWRAIPINATRTDRNTPAQ